MKQHCSWGNILILIYRVDAHDLKNGNAHATKWWKNALRSSVTDEGEGFQTSMSFFSWHKALLWVFGFASDQKIIMCQLHLLQSTAKHAWKASMYVRWSCNLCICLDKFCIHSFSCVLTARMRICPIRGFSCNIISKKFCKLSYLWLPC